VKVSLVHGAGEEGPKKDLPLLHRQRSHQKYYVLWQLAVVVEAAVVVPLNY
jgi:hypothetical protein